MSVTLNNAPDPINPRPKDPTATSLLLCNILVIAIALVEHWDLGFVMVVYWWQNIIIGYFNVLKMWHAKNFLPSAIPATQTLNPATGKIFLILFFIAHYGFFHFGYYSFLRKDFLQADTFWVTASVGIFFLNHWFSYRRNFEQDRQTHSIAILFMMPYPRIIPMHITIIVGGFFMLLLQSFIKSPEGLALGQQVVLVFFLALKTKMDLAMHALEHDPKKYLLHILEKHRKKWINIVQDHAEK